ncbi:MAG: histidinol dehydrogenase [Pseudomonadota bacterium]
MARRLDIRQAGFEDAFNALMGAKREVSEDVGAVAADILADVKANGDAAVFRYTEKFDRLTLDAKSVRISEVEIDAAVKACPQDQLDALQFAADRIRAYHEKQRPLNEDFIDEAGVRLGWRWGPVSAAGLYVPGGTASYPSSVLMNAVPAKVAGVKRVVMTAPTPHGAVNPLVLAAARLAGVDEVYKIGGAQAVGALAYGTACVAPVDVIVGPGNAYVAAAKAQVFGTVGIDMIAGPSEILVVADADNPPAFMAADLLSQAEHDVSSQSILITDDGAYADAVAAAVETELALAPRAKIARKSWEENGAIILVESFDQAPALIDRIAPEHLELAVADPQALFDKISHAGSVFLGRMTPEAVGDYVAGANHVLPTARSARFASGLSVFDFMKRTSFIACDADSLARIGPAASVLAGAEGLAAHARSVDVRLGAGDKPGE